MERELQGRWPMFSLDEWIVLSNRCREMEVEIRQGLGIPDRAQASESPLRISCRGSEGGQPLTDDPSNMTSI